MGALGRLVAGAGFVNRASSDCSEAECQSYSPGASTAADSVWPGSGRSAHSGCLPGVSEVYPGQSIACDVPLGRRFGDTTVPDTAECAVSCGHHPTFAPPINASRTYRSHATSSPTSLRIRAACLLRVSTRPRSPRAARVSAMSGTRPRGSSVKAGANAPPSGSPLRRCRSELAWSPESYAHFPIAKVVIWSLCYYIRCEVLRQPAGCSRLAVDFRGHPARRR